MKLDLNELCGLTKKHQETLSALLKICDALGMDKTATSPKALLYWGTQCDDLKRVGDKMIESALKFIKLHIDNNCTGLAMSYNCHTDTWHDLLYSICILETNEIASYTFNDVEFPLTNANYRKQLINIIKSHKK